MWSSFSPLFIAHMTEPDTNKDTSQATRLYPEDQAKVDEFVARGVNSVERKPFKPIRLLIILIATVTLLSFFSQLLADWAGVY
jgi:hypothetical protein